MNYWGKNFLFKMKKFYKEKSFKLPIYYGKIVFIDSNDTDAILKNHGIDLSKEPFASTYEKHKELKSGETEVYHLIICNTKTKLDFNIGVLAHECFHLTNFIFEGRCIKPDLENDEPQAYLLGFLMNKAYDFYYK